MAKTKKPAENADDGEIASNIDASGGEAEFLENVEDVDEIPKTIVVEIAKQGRAQCKRCDSKILAKSIRCNPSHFLPQLHSISNPLAHSHAHSYSTDTQTGGIIMDGNW